MTARSRAPEFFSPLPQLAVAALVLNDHVFKATFHNALTGKVSDFAGCFFLPLYISASLAFVTTWSWQRRSSIGVVVTALLFGAIKLSQHTADVVTRSVEFIASPLGIGRLHIVSDPTDLLALSMLSLAVLYARKVHRPCVAPSS